MAEWTDAGMTGFRPDSTYAPRGWGYNVVKINLSEAADYLIVLGGDSEGSEGADSHFEGRIVVMGNTGTRYVNLDMSGALVGSANVSVNAEDTALYIVVAAVPEHFSGYQNYSYTLDVTRE